MPVTAFLHPHSGERVEFADAPALFEEEGLLPYAETHALIKECTKDRGPESGLYLYPSAMNPETTCRREMVIQRFLPYAVSPWATDARNEGTLWHDLYSQQPAGPGHIHELRLPLEGQGRLCEDGKWRVEVWPGVWLSTRIDRLGPGEIADYKSRKYPKVFYRKGSSVHDPSEDGSFLEDLKRDWGLQINLEKAIVEACAVEKAPSPEQELIRFLPITDLWVWRKFLGSHDPRYTRRKIPIAPQSAEQVWERIGGWVNETLAILRGAYEVRDDLDALVKYIDTVPADGHVKQMFRGTKCAQYCDAKSECSLFKEANVLSW